MRWTSPAGPIWAGRWSCPTEKVGTFDTELGKEFWLAFVRSCPSAVHLKQLAGENSHHILEAVFKGMGRALRQAVAIEPGKEGRNPQHQGPAGVTQPGKEKLP